MSSAFSLGQYPPALRTLVHLSDTHLLQGGAQLGGRFDPDANLARTLAAIEGLATDIDALVITGDLTDLGEPEAYRALRAAVEPVGERLGCPVVWVAGNHDERPALREALLGEPADERPITSVHDLGGLRLIAVDTSVPGWHHGELGMEQLSWLRSELRTLAPLGTILAMHHPPLPNYVPLFDILELRDQPALAAAISGSDVRAILAGHLHYCASGSFAGVPVSVASSTCYSMNLARPVATANGMDAAQSFHVVQVYNDTVTHTTIPVVTADTVDFFDEDWLRHMASLTPSERAERFSRKLPQDTRRDS